MRMGDLMPFQIRRTPSALSMGPVLAVETFPIVQNQSNLRVPWFGKRVQSVPGQEGGQDPGTSPSDRPMTREKWTNNGAVS